MFANGGSVAEQAADEAGKLACAAAVAASAAIAKHAAGFADKTDWLELAPPKNDVTMGYIIEQKDMQGLASILALQNASEATQQRGSLYPFRMLGKKSNGLLQAATWLSDKYVLAAVASQTIDVVEAEVLCTTHTRGYHLIRARVLLESWTNEPASAWDLAETIHAHAHLSKDESLLSACTKLLNASFLAQTPHMPGPPTEKMTENIALAVQGKPCDDKAVSHLIPKMIAARAKNAAERVRGEPDPNAVWASLKGLAIALCVPDSLQFDV